MSRPGPQQHTPAPSVDSENELRQKYLQYFCLSERISVHLRYETRSNIDEINLIRDQAEKEFQKKYPPQLPPKDDREGVAKFWKQCLEDMHTMKPDLKSLSLTQCDFLYLVCVTAVQAIQKWEMDHLEDSKRVRLTTNWHDEAVQKALEYEREYGMSVQSTDESEHQLVSPSQYIGRIVQAATPDGVKDVCVVDILSSHVQGTSVKLQDPTTKVTTLVSLEDFEEWVLPDSALASGDSENSDGDAMAMAED